MDVYIYVDVQNRVVPSSNFQVPGRTTGTRTPGVGPMEFPVRLGLDSGVPWSSGVFPGVEFPGFPVSLEFRSSGVSSRVPGSRIF